VDSAFCISSQESTYGIEFRDHHRSIILVAILIIGNCSSAEEAEAQIIWEGMNLAVAHNLIPTILESDCAVYNNIEVFRRLMPSCVVPKAGKKCNGAAYNLAQLARNRNSSSVWYAPVPVAIRDLCNHNSVNSYEL
jgi:hypothetical protein